MATKLSVYNQALLELKQRKISSLAEASLSRRTLDDFWDPTVAWMLAEGLWNFAMRSVAIEASTDVEPEFGFTYAVEQPEDYVRLCAIAGNGDFWPTLDRYHVEGGFWHTFVDPLYVRYVSNGNSYGGDLALWTPSFERALVLELARRVGPHLAGIGRDTIRDIEKAATRALTNARSKDAIEQMADRPPPGRLVNARLQGSRLSRRNRGLWDNT